MGVCKGPESDETHIERDGRRAARPTICTCNFSMPHSPAYSLPREPGLAFRVGTRLSGAKACVGCWTVPSECMPEYASDVLVGAKLDAPQTTGRTVITPSNLPTDDWAACDTG